MKIKNKQAEFLTGSWSTIKWLQSKVVAIGKICVFLITTLLSDLANQTSLGEFLTRRSNIQKKYGVCL
jgi:hypothetical protein